MRGVFEKRRFLDLVRYFIVFEDDGGSAVIKKMAGYHQFHAVNMAVAETIRAASAGGDGIEGRAGAATSPRNSPAAKPATGASASSGTRRDRARA